MGLENHHLKRPGHLIRRDIYIYIFFFGTLHQPELLDNWAVFPDTNIPEAEVLPRINMAILIKNKATSLEN